MRAPIRHRIAPTVTHTNLHSLTEYEPAHGRAGYPAPAQRTAQWPAHRRHPASRPPEVRVQHVVRAVLEVLDGRRSINQLRNLLTERAYDALLAETRARRDSGLRLRGLRTCWPSPVAVEVSATVLAGRRVRAAAARLELRRELWLCTDFALL